MQVRPLSILEKVNLAEFNTLGLHYCAEYFAVTESERVLLELLLWAGDNNLPIQIIGGGSNLVIEDDVPGLTILMRIPGITIVSEQGDEVHVEVAAGEQWHEFVSWSVEQSLWGIENLALIPGTVGAAPVQNIGAYGVEVGDVIDAVKVMCMASGQTKWISSNECCFSYRDSNFKTAWAGQFTIVAVRFTLTKSPRPVLGYGGLVNNVPSNPTLADIFRAVCETRQSKLPDPRQLANVGSYFKNPIVSTDCVASLKESFPDLVAFPAGDEWKLAAGWLIDKAGWKGKRVGGVGVYEKQALVLVNYEDQKACGLLALQAEIENSVKNQFGITLEREPVRVPSLETMLHGASSL